MLGKKSRERRRGRRAATKAFAVLDDVVDYELKVHAREVEPDPARYETAPVVERLLAIYGGDPESVVAVCSDWFESRAAGRTEEDDDRVFLAGVVHRSIGLVGVGNLFGRIPEDSHSYVPEARG